LFTRALLSFGIFLAVITPGTAFAARMVSETDWEPRPGDSFYVNTNDNWGYLLHHDSSEVLAFPVATGIQGTINYLGMRYYAGTPDANWIAKTASTQSDRTTFGPTGLFLRLFKNGDQYTRYGIHGHAYSQNWLTLLSRYKSAGCIVTSEQILQIIKTTFDVNGGQLEVTTSKNQDKIMQEMSIRDLREKALAL